MKTNKRDNWFLFGGLGVIALWVILVALLDLPTSVLCRNGMCDDNAILLVSIVLGPVLLAALFVAISASLLVKKPFFRVLVIIGLMLMLTVLACGAMAILASIRNSLPA